MIIRLLALFQLLWLVTACMGLPHPPARAISDMTDKSPQWQIILPGNYQAIHTSVNDEISRCVSGTPYESQYRSETSTDFRKAAIHYGVKHWGSNYRSLVFVILFKAIDDQSTRVEFYGGSVTPVGRSGKNAKKFLEDGKPMCKK